MFSTQKEWEAGIRKDIDYRRYATRFMPLSQVKANPPSVLVALTVEDAQFLSRNQSPRLAGHRYLSPPGDAIEICDDKWIFCNWMVQQGFGEFIPPVAPYEEELDYPYILKKRIDAFGRNAHIIRQPGDLKAIEVQDPAEYYKQAYIINDREYTCHLLFKDGCIAFHKTLCFRYDSGYYVKGIQSAYASRTETPECPYLSTFAEILKAMNFSGICCFNYKLAGDRFYIFEINPRVGASLLPYMNEVLQPYCS